MDVVIITMIKKMGNSEEKKDKKSFTFFKSKAQDNIGYRSDFTFFKNKGSETKNHEDVAIEKNFISDNQTYRKGQSNTNFRSFKFFPKKHQISNINLEKNFAFSGNKDLINIDSELNQKKSKNFYSQNIFEVNNNTIEPSQVRDIFLGGKNKIKENEDQFQNLSQFKNIFNPKLNKKLIEYHKVNAGYITQDFGISEFFINWVHDPHIINLCKMINRNRELHHFFIYLVSNTDKSIKKIREQLDDIGFFTPEGFLYKKAKEFLKDNYKLRFPSGKAKNKPLDKNNLRYNNLLNNILIQDFKEFHEQSGLVDFYSNTGQVLRDAFIKWIKRKYEFDSFKRFLLLEKIEKINKNREIAQYILHFIVNTNLSQLDIVLKLLEIFIRISRETIRNIGIENLSTSDYKRRFSRGDGWKNFINTNIKHDDEFSNLLNSEIQRQFEQYYLNTGNYANFGKKITNNFRNWINNKITDSEIKKRYLQIIQNINHNREIEKYIIFHVNNSINSQDTPLSLNSFSEKIKKLFLDISDTTIQRIVKKEIFKGKEDNFYKFFPIGGRERQLEISLDKLYFNDLLNSDLNQTFKDYTVYRKKLNVENIYANLGLEITQDFIKWIHKSNEILESLCSEINDKVQILSLILHYTLETNLNISEIKRKLLSIGLYVDRGTIRRNTLKFAFKNNLDDYNQRFQGDISDICGKLVHKNSRCLITQFFYQIYKNKYKYYSEVEIFPPSNKKADGFLNQSFLYDRLSNHNDSVSLQNQLKIKDKLLDDLIGIQFDFTSDLSDENIVEKIIKYQNESILLVIVGTNWKYKIKNQKIIPDLLEIIFPDRVLILSPKLLSIFLNFNTYYREEFNKIMEYSKNLDVTSLEHYYNINFENPILFNTDDLKKDLSVQKFNNYFFDPEVNNTKYIHPLIISKKFINYCKSRFLNVKEITRGNSIGTYYIFESFNLRDFNNTNNTSFNLIKLAELLGNCVGKDRIFFKKIIKNDRSHSHRAILIDKNFLDNYNNF